MTIAKSLFSARLRRSRAMAVFLASLSLGFATSSVATAATADPTEDDLNKQGVEARKRDDDAGALDLFRRAYQLHRSPRAAAQMGLAEIALGRWSDAESHLDEALRATGDPWIQKNEKVLRESLERVRNQFGNLQILGAPRGAEVVIEGKVVGTLPMGAPIRVRTGECRFEVRAPGYATASRTVSIDAAVPRRETVDLAGVAPPAAVTEATPREPTPSVAPSSPTFATAGSPPPAPEQTSPVGAQNGSRRLRTIGVILGAAGAAAVVGGAIFGFQARSAGQDNSQPGNTYDPEAESRGKRFQTIQYIGWGVGTALIVAGTVTFVMGLGSDQEPQGTTAFLVPVVDGGALAGWSGRF